MNCSDKNIFIRDMHGIVSRSFLHTISIHTYSHLLRNVSAGMKMNFSIYPHKDCVDFDWWS